MPTALSTHMLLTIVMLTAKILMKTMQLTIAKIMHTQLTTPTAKITLMLPTTIILMLPTMITLTPLTVKSTPTLPTM